MSNEINSGSISESEQIKMLAAECMGIRSEDQLQDWLSDLEKRSDVSDNIRVIIRAHFVEAVRERFGMTEMEINKIEEESHNVMMEQLEEKFGKGNVEYIPSPNNKYQGDFVLKEE